MFKAGRCRRRRDVTGKFTIPSRDDDPIEQFSSEGDQENRRRPMRLKLQEEGVEEEGTGKEGGEKGGGEEGGSAFTSYKTTKEEKRRRLLSERAAIPLCFSLFAMWVPPPEYTMVWPIQLTVEEYKSVMDERERRYAIVNDATTFK